MRQKGDPVRHLAALALLAALAAACTGPGPVKPPPTQRFYFPSGLVHQDVAGSTHGMLYVANADFDKRFDRGSLVAVDLDVVGLPAFGDPVPAAGPPQLTQLGLTDQGTVLLASFAGELAAWRRPGGGLRLFVPSRSEGDLLQVVDAAEPRALTCATSEGRDCSEGAFSLTGYEDAETDLPRAVSPYAVAVSAAGQVYVAHLTNADSPRGTAKNLTSYVVKLDAEAPAVDASSFVPLGPGAVNSVALGQRWVYLSGRSLSTGTQLVRLLGQGGEVAGAGLEGEFATIEARGLALSSDEGRLYLATRGPDRLVVAGVVGPASESPGLRVVRAVPLPATPNAVVTVPRPGRSDLVVISCSSAGVLALYDDEVGGVVAQVPGIGLQPYAVAVDRQGAGARLYVSNFTDGRVAVVDVPQLDRPQEARVVAHLGAQQLCLTRAEREGGCAEDVK